MLFSNGNFHNGTAEAGATAFCLGLASAIAFTFTLGAAPARADIMRGVVTDSATQAGLLRVKVSTDSAHAVYTDSNGAFTLNTDAATGIAAGRTAIPAGGAPGVAWHPQGGFFSWPGDRVAVAIRICEPSGKALDAGGAASSRNGSAYPLPSLGAGIHFVHFRFAQGTRVFRVLRLGGNGMAAVQEWAGLSGGGATALRKGSAGSAANAVSFQRPGYRPVNLDVTGSREDIAVKMGFAPADTTSSLHPFFFAAEGVAAMSIVREGKVTWTYTPDIKGGEISDASLLANGNVAFAYQSGASVVGPDKKVLWNYPAGNDQIHTCQPIGLDKVFIVSNGNPARARIINIKTNAVLMEKVIRSGGTGVHGQFRNCRMTKAGTMLLAHMDVGGAAGGLSPVEEYDTASMQVIWSSNVAKGPWAALRLKNGNTLASAATSNAVYEISRAGAVVWQVSNTAPFAIPGIKLANNQTAQRLANGNTLITNWQEPDNAPKIIEITPGRRVVWALNTKYHAPFANTSTSMQLLDEPGSMEDFDLQR